jgi:rRNA biogenesis protein RRP5
MKLLVRVVAIRPLCVIVSLPNQLLGQIPITQISSKYTSMLEDEEANADVRDFNAADGEGHESSLSVLPNMVSEGQFVSATVLAIHPRGANTHDRPLGRDELLRASQRVELSILPSLVNSAISKENIADGAVR